MMRIALVAVLLSSTNALASGLEEASGAFNWFTLGDPHSLPMGWVFLNFLIFVAGLVFVIKGPVMTSVRARADRFEALLRASEDARKAAEERQAELQAKLDALSGDIADFRAASDTKLERQKELIIAAAHEEIERAARSAEIALTRKRRAAERRLSQEAARLAFAVATERVEAAVGAADQERLSAAFVADVEVGS
jgi:F-type H+-transporting ATPase subunit b